MWPFFSRRQIRKLDPRDPEKIPHPRIGFVGMVDPFGSLSPLVPCGRKSGIPSSDCRGGLGGADKIVARFCPTFTLLGMKTLNELPDTEGNGCVSDAVPSERCYAQHLSIEIA